MREVKTGLKGTLIALLLIAGAMGTLSAQTVEEICKEHVAALGATDTVHSVYIELGVETNGMQLHQVSYMETGRTFYQQISFPGGSQTMCVRDGKGWTANSMQPGQAQDMPAQTVVAIMVNTDAFGPIHDYATRGDSSVVKSVELVGEMAVDGVQCYALKVTFKAGGEAKVYLGKKDKLLVRADLGDNGTMRYSFYEKRHGVQIPTVTEISNAMGSMTGRLTRFEVNYPMDAKLLKRP